MAPSSKRKDARRVAGDESSNLSGVADYANLWILDRKRNAWSDIAEIVLGVLLRLLDAHERHTGGPAVECRDRVQE